MKVSIFGAGTFGLHVFNYLSSKGIKVANFYDNNKSKQGKMFSGIPVYDPELINNNSPTIIIASSWWKQIQQQLSKLRFENYIYFGHLGPDESYIKWKDNLQPISMGLDFFHSQTTSPNIRWSLPAWLSSSSELWAVQLCKIYNHPSSFPASLSPAAGELYRSLIFNISPRNIMEIGVFMGASTLWAASAINDLGSSAKIYSVDLYDNDDVDHNHLNYVQKRVNEAKFDNYVNLLKYNSITESNKVLSHITDTSIDFLFIDGDHTPLGMNNDFQIYSEKVSKGGYLLFHDIFPDYCGWDGPAYVIDKYILNSKQYEICQIYTTPNNYGMALVRKLS